MKRPVPLDHQSVTDFYAGIRIAEAGEPRPDGSVWQQRGWDFVEDRRALDRLMDGVS